MMMAFCCLNLAKVMREARDTFTSYQQSCLCDILGESFLRLQAYMYEEEDDPFDDEESFTPTELKVVVVGVSGVGKTSFAFDMFITSFKIFRRHHRCLIFAKDRQGRKISFMLTTMGYSWAGAFPRNDTPRRKQRKSTNCSV